MLRCTAFPAAILVAATLHAQTAPDSVMLAKADTLRAHQHYKEAYRIYDQLVERDALLVPALSGRAACNTSAQQAMEDLQRALTLRPGDFRSLIVRSTIYENSRMYERAIADLDLAIAAAPDTLRLLHAMNDQAWDRICLREFDTGIAQLWRIQAIDSTDSRSMNSLALAYEEQGDTAAAYTQLLRFIASDTASTTGYHNMAYFLSRHNRHAEALRYWNMIERKAGDDAYYLNNRGYTRLMLGDTKGALKDIQRSLRINKANSYAYRNLGLTYQAMDRKDDACDAFENAIAYGFTERFGDEVKRIHATYCH